jgi:putative ABC transport system substrate-binding protein
MRRREFLIGQLAVTVVFPAAAQGAKPRRLVIFSPFESVSLMQENGPHGIYPALFAELRRRGWVEGANLAVARYGKEQLIGDLDTLAAAAMRDRPDVAFTVGLGTFEIKAHAGTTPMVTFTYDPIALGLTQSLSHPGGDITGISVDTGPSIWGKRIELLREIYPRLSRLAFLALRAPSWESFLRPAIAAACEAASISFVPVLVDVPTTEASYRQAIAGAARDGADALMVAENPETVTNRGVIAASANAARLPAMYALREFVDAGGLIAYAPNLTELSQRVAADIDAILRGAKPGEIPFFQGTKFDLIINRKTAAALGIVTPPLLMAQAAEILE